VREPPTGLNVPSLRQRADPISRLNFRLRIPNFGRRRRNLREETKHLRLSPPPLSLSLENGEHLDERLTEDPLGVCLQIDRRLRSLTYPVSLCTKCRIRRNADGIKNVYPEGADDKVTKINARFIQITVNSPGISLAGKIRFLIFAF